MQKTIFGLQLVNGGGRPPLTTNEECIAAVMRAADDLSGVCHEWAEHGGLRTHGNSPMRLAVRDAVKAAMAAVARQQNEMVSDASIVEWANRHEVRTSPAKLRQMVEDARSLHLG